MTTPSLLSRRTAMGAALLTLGLAQGASAACIFGAPTPGAPQIVVQVPETTQVGDVCDFLAARGHSPILLDQIAPRPIYLIQVDNVERSVIDLSSQDQVAIDYAEANVQVSIDDKLKGKLNTVLAIGNSASDVPEAAWVAKTLRLTEAHTISRGAGVRVAVVDTGVSHPDLDASLSRWPDGTVRGYDFIDDDADASEEGAEIVDPANYGPSNVGHGTHVAGTIVRLAPDATLMPVRVLNPDGVGDTFHTAKAVFWALEPDFDVATDDAAHVVNLSLGTETPAQVLDSAIRLATCTGPALRLAPGSSGRLARPPRSGRAAPGVGSWDLDRQRCGLGRQAVVLAAAGNDGSATVTLYPAAYVIPGLRAVTASKRNRKLASFGNRGNWVDFAAPGDKITSTFAYDQRATISGTSMATPMVSGTAALLRALPAPGGAWTAEQLLQVIGATAAPMCDGSPFRHLDVAGAVGYASALPACR